MLRLSNHFRLRLYFLKDSGWRVLKLAPFFIYGCFSIWILHRLFDGDWFMCHAVVELRHISFFRSMVRMDLMRLSVSSRAVAHQQSALLRVSPDHSSLEIHGIDETAHVSSSARASEVNLVG